MKKLISAEYVRQAHHKKEYKLEIDNNTHIITPEAIQVAEQLGVEIIAQTSKISYPDKQKIIDQVQKKITGGKYSRAAINKALDEVLSKL